MLIVPYNVCLWKEDSEEVPLAHLSYLDDKKKVYKFAKWKPSGAKTPTIQQIINSGTDGFKVDESKAKERTEWKCRTRTFPFTDPRGFVVNISYGNYCRLLSEQIPIEKQTLVYAWRNNEIQLLPEQSREVRSAYLIKEEIVSKGLGSKSMMEGLSYIDKSGRELIYLGKQTWYEWDESDGIISRVENEENTFYYPDADTFIPYKSFSSLVSVVGRKNAELSELSNVADSLKRKFRVTPDGNPTNIIGFGSDFVDVEGEHKVLNDFIYLPSNEEKTAHVLALNIEPTFQGRSYNQWYYEYKFENYKDFCSKADSSRNVFKTKASYRILDGGRAIRFETETLLADDHIPQETKQFFNEIYGKKAMVLTVKHEDGTEYQLSPIKIK